MLSPEIDYQLFENKAKQAMSPEDWGLIEGWRKTIQTAQVEAYIPYMRQFVMYITSKYPEVFN